MYQMLKQNVKVRIIMFCILYDTCVYTLLYFE